MYRLLRVLKVGLPTKCRMEKPLRVSGWSYSWMRRLHVLGIETSCDDTGAAIVNENGHVLGDCINSQTELTVELGGVLPPVAADLHRQHIHQVVSDTLTAANMTLKDIDAIATTVKPGLSLSLSVGLQYSKMLLEDSKLPFIPIHHMEAHALTARMEHNIEFPFLVLLMSGGHCLLAVAQDINKFLVLGESLDDAPGDAFDKVARYLRLKNVPECVGLSGGRAVEVVARDGDPRAFDVVQLLTKYRSCDFSFTGLRSHTICLAKAQEKMQGISPPQVLSNVGDICASFQYSALTHIAKRLQRALLYCEMTEILPNENKTLVISGGVGSNDFFMNGLSKVCSEFACDIIRPPTQLCTDNGIMIAWNGMEKLRRGVDVLPDADHMDISPKSPLGDNVSEDVIKCSIKNSRIKLL